MLTSISEFVMDLVHIMTLGQRCAEIQFCFVFTLNFRKHFHSQGNLSFCYALRVKHLY